MFQNEVILIDSEDGERQSVYLDGVLKTHGHRLHPFEVLHALGIRYEAWLRPEEFFDTAGGNFPNAIYEVKSIDKFLASEKTEAA